MNTTWKILLASISALALAGCGDSSSEPETSGTVQAVSTFSILTDIVEEIGGEHVEVYNLVPVGQDPHEYESTPSDTKALSDADVFFVNGLNLEGGEQGGPRVWPILSRWKKTVSLRPRTALSHSI